MITPFLVGLKNGKYIYLNEDKVELYNEFPLVGKLELMENADVYRQFVQGINLNMISIIFLNSFNLFTVENRIIELLGKGSSSILKIIIDIHDVHDYEVVYKSIRDLKMRITAFRGIKYGMVLFYLRIKNIKNLNDNIEITDHNISVINYNYDYDIDVSHSFCNWVICSGSKHIYKIYNENSNANYIFDFTKMLQFNQVEEIVVILKYIKTKFRKRKIRLFPLSVNRLILHHNLENYCNCKMGINVCRLENTKTIFSCRSEGALTYSTECNNCALKELCGSCAIGHLISDTCSIRRVFNEYYSDMLHCKIEC